MSRKPAIGQRLVSSLEPHSKSLRLAFRLAQPIAGIALADARGGDSLEVLCNLTSRDV